MDENEKPTEYFEDDTEMEESMVEKTEEDESEKEFTPETKASSTTKRRIPAVPISAQLIVLGVIMLMIFSSGITSRFLPNDNGENVVKETNNESVTQPAQASEILNFDDVSITAKSAFVWDVKNQKVLFEKNPDEQLPLASITKLMTALLAYEIVSTDHTIAITDQAIWQDGDSGLRSGEYFNFQDLLDLTLMSSSNDGAFALASAAGSLLESSEPAATFVDAMNIRAGELNLNQTYFHNPTGLDITEEESGAYGSSRDVSFLLEYIIENAPDLLSATKEDDELIYNQNGEYHQASNTNPVVSQIPGLLASKTGYTTLAGGNLTIAFNAGLDRPIIVTVLGSTRNDRFYDVLKLSAAAQAALTNQ